jgi:hypothetical protein
MQVWNPPKIYKNVNQVDVFVLTCIDPRFTYFLTWFLNHSKEARNNYDLFALAGSSMCADLSTQTPPSGSGLPSTTPWLTTFNNHIALASSLHHIQEVWIFDHLGCGAYKNYLDDDSPEKHIVNMRKMRDHVKTLDSKLIVKLFLMDIDGSIQLIESEGGLQKFTMASYTPQNKWIIMFWTTFALLIGFLKNLF